jgi:hypothetical protein
LLNGISKESAAMPTVFDGVAVSGHIGSRAAALRPLAREWQMAREVSAGLMREDRVELSTAAGEGNRCPDTPRIRDELVERIRRSIAAGDYLTSEKIDVTVTCIYQALLGH